MNGYARFVPCLCFSIFCGVALIGTNLLRAAEPPEEPIGKRRPPNILLIYTDDQSYKTVGCYPESFSWVRTPHIDKLAASGIRFSGCYIGSWCMPSRATMLTGRLPHGIESMRMEGAYPGATYDPQQTPFWPKVFRERGYQTAQIGKWHTGVDAGFGRDWDYQIVWNRPKYTENAGNYYEDQTLEFNGEKRQTAGYSTDNYTKWACDYIRGDIRAADKPWYLWLCYGGVHGPSHPAKRHKGQYKAAEVKQPADIFPPRPGKPAYLEKTQAWAKGPNGQAVMGKSGEKFGDESKKNAKTHAAWVQQVNECVLSLDEGVGQVIDALRESGQLENTLVVFTADQGFSMGEHGFRTKLAPYDANYRSPLIISQPGTIPAGKSCEQPIGGQDLVVTFFQQAGMQLPWKMHGRDLSPLLKDPQTKEWNHPVLYEHMGHDFGSDTTKVLSTGGDATHSNVPWYVALRSGKLKYVRTLKAGETEELYDLATDPEELTNVIGSDKYQTQLSELRTLMTAELKRTEAGFIEHMPKTASGK
ncbi:Arylsulfatase [Anatilimnocola aggregata]|uniref:Arylsulfatase n=1 Tax=Anatilimnocola aggregata TaxID=2528021 RepID=A0A517YMT3_9BACT|nr:sulfatase-like hydrolase/transferase [Anatilimnocola aggregata]QDU31536.1 Arylsulfatase [Anatilimnocola aggregata]